MQSNYRKNVGVGLHIFSDNWEERLGCAVLHHKKDGPISFRAVDRPEKCPLLLLHRCLELEPQRRGLLRFDKIIVLELLVVVIVLPNVDDGRGVIFSDIIVSLSLSASSTWRIWGLPQSFLRLQCLHLRPVRLLSQDVGEEFWVIEWGQDRRRVRSFRTQSFRLQQGCGPSGTCGW